MAFLFTEDTLGPEKTGQGVMSTQGKTRGKFNISRKNSFNYKNGLGW